MNIFNPLKGSEVGGGSPFTERGGAKVEGGADYPSKCSKFGLRYKYGFRL